MRNHVKRFLSVFLVSLLLSQEVLADVSVPAVPIGSVAPSAVMATASDAIPAEGEPFYYDEDGNKVYDSDIDWSEYRMDQDDYADIMWTFEDYPQTMMSNGNASTYVVGVDDAVLVAIFVAACAACGYYISKSDAVEMISKGFEPWLRRVKGASTEVMTVWQTLFALKPGSSFGGMRIFVRLVKEYLDSLSIDSGAITVPVNSSKWYVEPPLPDWNKNFSDKYLLIRNAYRVVDSGIEYTSYAFVKSEIDLLSGGYVIRRDDGFYDSYLFLPLAPYKLFLTAMRNTLYNGGYWSDTKSYSYGTSFSDVPLEFIYSLSVPVFVSKSAYNSWKEFGTTGGLLNGDADSILTVNTVNQWTDLQRDFFNKYNFSDVLTIPETQAEFDALIDSLSQAQIGTDVITNLKPIWDITEKSGGSVVSPTVAYSGLSYTLDAIAAYVGVTSLDASLRNGFIADYFNTALSGLTIDQLNTYAQTIVNSQISIKGTAEDHDANTFVVTAGLTSAFLSYLLSAGLIDSIPEVKAGTQLKSNVKVETKIDAGTTTPDSGTTDLTGILGILSSILSVLGGLPALIATEIIKSLVSSAFANGITLNLDTIRSSLSNIAQWDFADWTTALGAAMLLALKNFAIDFRLDGFADALDSIAQWDFADWDTAFGSAMKAALMALGIDRIVGLADVLKNWDFSDWSGVFRSVLDAALVSSGLAGLAGILTGIKDSLKGLGISIDLSPLTDALTGVKDAVISIPGQITDFFTIDTAVIADAFVSLQTAFIGRFSGISQLASVFDRSYSFDIVYPVIKIPIPEEPEMLRVMFDGKTELVFLDLNPFAENLAYVRNLLIAMLYVSFAFWFLGEFDVKFHIG